MSNMTPSLERLSAQFAALPGIGRKSAARLAHHVLNMSEQQVKSFVDSIMAARVNVKSCKVCCNYSESDVCPICADSGRDRTTICVVEDSRAAEAIEMLHEYKGLYHVLNGVISPMDGIGPEQLHIKELLSRLDADVFEVIVATNPSVEGEATAMYLGKLIRPLNIKVTRLAYGLPVGATLEFADEVTLLRAMEGRTVL